MYKKLLITFLSSTFLLLADDRELIVGTNAEFPPFSYIENNQIVGFDIDVANEVSQRLGKKISLKDMPFEALIPEVILGRLDFVAAGISHTEERAKRVSFSKPYLTADPFVIFTKSKLIHSLSDLKNKTVVVIEGFTADLFMSSIDKINLIRLPTQADGFMAIKSGRADAFITAKSTVESFFEVQDSTPFQAIVLEGTGEAYALVVPKNKPDLLEEIQKAINDMESDGTMAKLKTKWKFQ